MAKTKVSIIIPTKNEEKNLPTLFASLAKQTFKNFEVILVDNNSKDKTLQIAKKYNVQVFTAGSERSSQRNFGAKKAKGKFLLFLDADMQLQSQVIEECVNVLESNPNLSGVIIPEVGIAGGFWAKVKALEKKIYAGEKIIEAGRFFKHNDFLKVGGYKEDLVSGEDWDLSERMEKLGHLGRISTSIFHGENNLSLLKELKKKYYYAKHIEKYAKYNPERFRAQAGINRLVIFLRQSDKLLKDPLHTLGLLGLKSFHLALYLWAKFRPDEK